MLEGVIPGVLPLWGDHTRVLMSYREGLPGISSKLWLYGWWGWLIGICQYLELV